MKKTLFPEEASLRGRTVCGIDEVGRGPLAGPVVAAAVILPEGFSHPDIRDSKKLKGTQISRSADIVRCHAVCIGIGLRDAAFIDDNDILTATFRAMEDAVGQLTVRPDVILIDGNHTNPFLKGFQQIALIQGEGRSQAIAAASIIAKDYRDRLMDEFALQYPQYAFEKHKGYGTKLHCDLLRKHGPSPIHRMSFCKVRGSGHGSAGLFNE